MVPAGYFLLVIFSNYFTVKRGNLAYFSSFLSLLKSNLKKSLIGSTQLGPFWIAIMNLYIKSFQKIYIFWECLIFCLNQTLAGCVRPPPRWSGVPSAALWRLWRPAARWTRRPSSSRWGCWLRLPSWRRLCTASSTKTANPKRISCWRWICLWRRIHWKWLWGIPAKLWPAPAWYHTMQFGT